MYCNLFIEAFTYYLGYNKVKTFHQVYLLYETPTTTKLYYPVRFIYALAQVNIV